MRVVSAMLGGAFLSVALVGVAMADDALSPSFEDTGALEDARAQLREAARHFGADAIAAHKAARRARLKEIVDAADAFSNELDITFAPAGIAILGGLAVRPRFGWRRSSLDDIDEEACASWMAWASFCHDEPAAARRRFMVVIDDDLGDTRWETHAGVAMTLKSGLVADIAYKEFDGPNHQNWYTPAAIREGLEDRGVMFSLTVPCGG